MPGQLSSGRTAPFLAFRFRVVPEHDPAREDEEKDTVRPVMLFRDSEDALLSVHVGKPADHHENYREDH
jgi:hypothetical protein